MSLARRQFLKISAKTLAETWQPGEPEPTAKSAPQPTHKVMNSAGQLLIPPRRCPEEKPGFFHQLPIIRNQDT